MKKSLLKISALVICTLMLLAIVGCNAEVAPTTKAAPQTDTVGTETSTPEEPNAKPKYKFVMVCNILSEPFWGTVRKGMEDAAALLNVDAEYIGPQNYDIAAQVNTFETIIDTDIDGVAVFISEGEALQNVIKTAMDKGIPVTTFNNDAPNSARMAYVGQSEYAAGQQMGREIAALVPEGSVIFAGNHHPGQSGITDRIAGVENIVSEYGIKIEQAETPETDPTKVLSTLESYYAKNPDVKAFLAFNPSVAATMGKWLEESNLVGTIKLGCFDTSTDILNYIKSGTIDFTIDQQPYLQGFQSIMQLYLYQEYGLYPATINTGGAVINSENVDQVIELVAAGYR